MIAGPIKKLIILAVAFILLSAAFLVISRKQVFIRIAKDQDISQQFTKKEAASIEVASFIVPHHLVARDMIDETFRLVVEKNGKMPESVVPISPNHFNLGKGWIIGSNQNWKTENGEVSADKETIKSLQNEKLVNIEPEAFVLEHGIRDVLPFIAKYFPGASVVPLMVKDGMPEELIIRFTEKLADEVSENTLLVLSSDFSHELDENISDFHDRQAIEALANFSFKSMKNLETDCLPGLEIISRYSQMKGYSKFNLVANSNSSKIYSQHFSGDNTSYVTGYYSKEIDENIEKTANILFFGDMMLDGDVRTLVEKKGIRALAEKIKRLFWAQDLNVANLEGPITDNQSVSVGTEESDPVHFKFTFDPQTAAGIFKELNINTVSLGNNHILNFNTVGLNQTKENLEKSGIKYFGAPGEENSLVENIDGKKITLVSYNQFDTKSLDEALYAIEKNKLEAGVIIVYAHWGTEYALAENEKQTEIAHKFIDAGADLVIGSHPHVVQPIEIYNSKAIFYSLGNFIFDQYFSDDVRERLAVGVSIGENKFDFLLVPLYLEKNGELVLMEEKRRGRFLGRIAENSSTNTEVSKNIKSGKFSINR